MCYSIAQMKKRAYDAALREGASQEMIDKLFREWQAAEEGEDMLSGRAMYYVNGFEHPRLYTIINQNGLTGTRFNWGLIPAWVKDEKQAHEIWNQTLNARGETIFEKASFKDSANSKRCLILVDGFYEYHHFKGKTYPFFIQPKAPDVPFIFGGLWSEWVNKETGEIIRTATIVTTEGNALMSKIHNNPKASGPRMPVILEPKDINVWLNSTDQNEIKDLIKPCQTEILIAHTVGRVKGKNAVPDSAQSIEKVEYPELSEF